MLDSINYLWRELGLASLHSTGRDAYLIILARACRMFAYGTNALVLALFFSALDFSDTRIGLFMTLTLVGDVLLGLLLTLVADRVGRRRTLFAGSVLMVFSGATFALFENFWILLVAAVVGVISVSGSDLGPFRAIEESILSHLTTPQTRADVLAWYVTTASLGSAAGTEILGRVVQALQSREGWTIVDAYHACFWVYSGMGCLNIVFSMLLTSKCEVKPVEEDERDPSEEAGGLLGDQDSDSDDEPEGSPSPPRPQHPPAPAPAKPKSQSRFAQISAATRSVMYKLWFLLVIDSLADGMTPLSLTNYYMDQKFHLRKSTLGDISSVGYFLSSISSICAGPLARHLGLINTMVFTHLPSSTAVLLFPLPPNLVLTVILFFIRMGLNNMDQAPRAAFIAAVVKPEERTAVMGITAMLRTLAATTGPTVTGFLAGSDRFWIAFVVAGALRIGYDIGLFVMFVNMKLHQHEPDGPEAASKERADSRHSTDEEELRDLSTRAQPE